LLAPEVVTNVEVTDLNSSSIRVSWTPPSQPNGIILYYIVTLSSSEGSPPPPVNISAETGLVNYNQEFHNLRAFTHYTVTITAATIIGEGEGTLRVVRTDPFRASAPTMVSTDQVEAMSFRITWGYPDSPRGEIGGYLIMVTIDETMEVTKTINVTLPVLNNNESQQINIPGLRPYTLYSYSIRAFSYDYENFVLHEGDVVMGSQRTGEARK